MRSMNGSLRISVRRTLMLATLGMLSIASPARTHHSQGMYDSSTWLTLEGTVRQMNWTFPHASIYLDVQDDQRHAQTWSLGAGNPNAVQDAGVSKDDIRPGDRIKVRCHPLRDGWTGCVLGFVTPMHGDRARGHGVERAWN